MSMPRPTIDLAHALPRRAIAVRPPPAVGSLATLGLFALLFATLVGVLWWLGPDLVRDWRIRGDAVAASEVRIEQARCRTWLALIKVCDVTYANGADGSTRRLWYLFFGASGEERMELLRSRSDPAQVSTRLGLERLYNRSIALALLTAILGFCVGAAVQVVHKVMRLQRVFAAMSGQRLTPVAVEIERKNIVPPRRRMWVYLYDDGGRVGRAVVELSSKDGLVFLTADEKWALALRGEQGGTPLLLDSRLTCLDLTEGEKAAFHEACRAALRA